MLFCDAANRITEPSAPVGNYCSANGDSSDLPVCCMWIFLFGRDRIFFSLRVVAEAEEAAVLEVKQYFGFSPPPAVISAC